MRNPALLAALMLLGACSSDNSRMKSDWERANEPRIAAEESRAAGIEPPEFPRKDRLVRFFVSSASDFAFFVDPDTISVGKDRIVRYVLVARSPNAVDNVTYEGINCADAEFAIYAVGLASGTWRTAPVQWKPIERRSVQRWHEALYREYFCPRGVAVADGAEAAAALRRGGHPWSQDTPLSPR